MLEVLGPSAMSSSTEVSRCIAHLHRTELHGQLISVEKVSLLNCLNNSNSQFNNITLVRSRIGNDFLFLYIHFNYFTSVFQFFFLPSTYFLQT